MARPKSKGAYAPLAAQYYLDDAILEVGPDAELLYVRCLAFLASVSTDGFLTERQMKVVGIGLRSVPKRVELLLQVGLLEASPGGFVARSWLKWNKSAAQTDRHLRNDRERKARKDEDLGGNSRRIPDGFQTDSSPQLSAVQLSSVKCSSVHTPTVQEFDLAWAHWPKKVERKKAFERFKIAAPKHPDLVTDIIRFGDAYAATTEKQFVPALGVWLSGERWTDELPQSRQTKPTKDERALSIIEQGRAMDEAQARKELSA